MASGFFLGGAAPGLAQAGQNIDNSVLNAGLIKLQGQQMMLDQKNRQQAQFMKLRSDAVSHLDETMTQLRAAHPDWSDNQLISNPAVRGLANDIRSLDKNMGNPDTIDSTVASIAARPSEIELKHQEAVATGSYGKEQAQTNEARARANALYQQYPANPDRPGLPQNGPSLGDNSTFNQRFAQEAQQDAPKVLSWGDARSEIAKKYGPEVATKAELWLKGNQSVVTGLGRGRGVGSREQIQNAAVDLAGLVGMDADQINQNFTNFKGKQAAATSGGRTAGSREANLGIILAATDSAIDAAIKASNDVPRSNFVPLTKLQMTGQEAISDPKLKVFQQKNLQLAELWAKSMNPTGTMRESDRDFALGVLNMAVGNKTYDLAAQSIRDSVGLERSAAKQFLKEKGYDPDSAPSPQSDENWQDTGFSGVKIRQVQ